jgi:hypothetical protein
MVLGVGTWEVIRFRRGHERGAPMMGLVSLQEEETKACFLCQVRTQGEDGRLQTKKSAFHWTLDFLASRTVSIPCLC